MSKQAPPRYVTEDELDGSATGPVALPLRAPMATVTRPGPDLLASLASSPLHVNLARPVVPEQDLLSPWNTPVGEAAVSTDTTIGFVRGPLPSGYVLVFPIPVEVWREGAEVVVAQPSLRLHSFGPDRASAIANFKAILVEQLDRLRRYEGRLSPSMEEDLNLLSALVRRDA